MYPVAPAIGQLYPVPTVSLSTTRSPRLKMTQPPLRVAPLGEKKSGWDDDPPWYRVSLRSAVKNIHGFPAVHDGFLTEKCNAKVQHL